MNKHLNLTENEIKIIINSLKKETKKTKTINKIIDKLGSESISELPNWDKLDDLREDSRESF